MLINLYLTQIFKLIKKNNKFTLLIWLIIISPIIKKVIIIYIITTICAFIKLIYILIFNKKISPQKKILDAIIFKIILATHANIKKKDLLFFIIFAYLIASLTPYSLKSIHLSILLYNKIKHDIFIKKKINIMTYHNIIIDDLLIKSTNLPHKIKFLNRHIYIN